jgi:hypothetical protein
VLGTEGESTRAIEGTVENLVKRRIGSTGKGIITDAFNTLAKQMENNGIYAAAPILAALGAVSGEGTLGRIFSAVAMAAVGYIGARIADAKGIQMPGLSLDFKAANSLVTVPSPSRHLAPNGPIPRVP